jgi:hypothetical protein
MVPAPTGEITSEKAKKSVKKGQIIMALKAKVANKVQTNDKGFAEGTIINVFETDERFEDSKGDVIDEEEFEELKKLGKKPIRFIQQYEFHIESEGTQKSVIYRLWTRQTFNNEKYEKFDGKTDYNDFTRLMIQLEMITESDLKDLDNPKLNNFDVESVEGLKIQFELQPSRKIKGLKEPKLTTIRPLKLVK